MKRYFTKLTKTTGARRNRACEIVLLDSEKDPHKMGIFSLSWGCFVGWMYIKVSGGGAGREDGHAPETVTK